MRASSTASTVAVIARSSEDATIQRIVNVLGSAAVVFQKASDALGAFHEPHKAIILLGHGYLDASSPPTEWALGGFSRPLLRWTDVPEEIHTQVLMFATCNAAGLADDARRRIGGPGVVITPSGDLNKAYNQDATEGAYQLAYHAASLGAPATVAEINQTWKLAERSLKSTTGEVGHHDWDYRVTWTEGDNPW
ncbi:hypothetical protein [Tsukamurella tyrosinosolvens]|uniref:hypothetical protein n=1 Tax=Tsukamurella tyrosinosolvens TaxID=57704 RepID=UPI002DD41D43|nr:hypothetical protein [Tsukamurella tyrosinosolvens]MEC4615514.1 hypothetical protein [Tsukamurella tyrosinosolvens]